MDTCPFEALMGLIGYETRIAVTDGKRATVATVWPRAEKRAENCRKEMEQLEASGCHVPHSLNGLDAVAPKPCAVASYSLYPRQRKTALRQCPKLRKSTLRGSSNDLVVNFQAVVHSIPAGKA